MAKGTVYYCSECGYKSAKWAGKDVYKRQARCNG